MTKSPMIKKYEYAYRAWLKKLFKQFGKFTLDQVLEAIKNDTELSPEIVEYFYSKINFDPVLKTFIGVLGQNEKYFESMINNIIKSIKTVNKKETETITHFLQKSLPQRAVYNSFVQEDIKQKGRNFFELEKDKIKGLMVKDFETRKNQLDDFRQSFLFNSPDKEETFKVKYPEPKYAFTASMGRTEVNNLNRDLSAAIATNIGAKRFIWSTSNDERVRQSHRELNDKKFSYDDMPSEYNAYNCRCVQIPIIDYLEDLY